MSSTEDKGSRRREQLASAQRRRREMVRSEGGNQISPTLTKRAIARLRRLQSRYNLTQAQVLERLLGSSSPKMAATADDTVALAIRLARDRKVPDFAGTILARLARARPDAYARFLAEDSADQTQFYEVALGELRERWLSEAQDEVEWQLALGSESRADVQAALKRAFERLK